jgi:NAD(P)-dependent dehydrogenase (short-subunit alcohol dehydrogenase family)
MTSEATTGLTAVVTGAARGIGLAVVERLAASGARVHALDLDSPEATCTDVEWHQLDVSSEEAVEAFFCDHRAEPAPGVLVNCAGGVEHTPLLASSTDQWDEMLRHNLSSVFLMTRGFAARAPDHGAVVNIGSVDAWHGNPGRAGYAVAKGGIEVFTRLAASQLAPRAIRVNTILAGAINTRMTPDPAAGDLCLLRRRGTPAEVAAAVAFLVSEEAGYITGATLRVDGGFGLR